MGNMHFFTISGHHQIYQNYQQPPQIFAVAKVKKVKRPSIFCAPKIFGLSIGTMQCCLHQTLLLSVIGNGTSTIDF